MATRAKAKTKAKPKTKAKAKPRAKKAAPVNEIEVSVAEVVDFLKFRGDFAPALAKVVRRKVTVDAARKKGIRVTVKELQNAADAFRAMNGLVKASDTHQWLAENGLTVDALEAHLETSILVSKFRDRLAKEASKKITGGKRVQAVIRDEAYQEWLAKEL